MARKGFVLLVAASMLMIAHDSDAGWTWISPLPQGNGLNAVCVASATEAYAVGDLGTILCWDGIAWQVTDSGTRAHLHDICSPAPGSYVIVGAGGLALHGDGQSWTASQVPTSADLRGVSATAPDAVYAVASSTSGDDVFRFDGNAWTGVAAIRPSGGLNDVWAAPSGEVFVVGGFLIGAMWLVTAGEWTKLYAHEDFFIGLEAVWGFGANDVYVAGGGEGFGGLVLRWDGTTMAEMEVPEEPHEEGLHGIWGTGDDDIFACGYQGRLLHWDGSAWAELDRPSGVELQGLGGTVSGTVFAVGRGGTILARSDPGWAIQTGGLDYHFGDVQGIGPDQAVAVAYGSVEDEDRGLIFRWDGSAWSQSDEVGAQLHGVWAESAESAVAVGERGGVAPHGAIFAWDGSAWSEQPVTHEGEFLKVWGASADDLFLLERHIDLHPPARGSILRGSGSTWDEQFTRGEFLGIWGFGPDHVLVVENPNYDPYVGYVLLWDGQDWSDSLEVDGDGLFGVWGSSPDDVYAVGEGPRAFHWDGSDWSELPVPGPEGTLLAVWGWSPDEVLAVGSGGRAVHFDGTTWTEATTVTANELTAVWGVEPGETFAVGEYGTILRWDGVLPTPTPTPTSVFTPTPTATPEAGVFAVRLELATTMARPGHAFWVNAYLDNFSGAPRGAVPTFILLDIYGSLYFWPSWAHYAPPASTAIDYRLLDLPQGTTSIRVIESFTWPDTGSDRLTGLMFHAAMLNPEMTTILGAMASATWGYGPED